MVVQTVSTRYVSRLGAHPLTPQPHPAPQDTFTLPSVRYGLAGLAPTYGLPQPLGLRCDTAIIDKKGLRHHLTLLNPRVNTRREKHELVLDVDDLAVALVPENGSAIIPIGHITSGILLGAGIGLAGWFALGASMREIGDATRILRRLRAERKKLNSADFDPQQAYPWRVKKERLQRGDAVREQHRQMGAANPRHFFRGPRDREFHH